MSIKLEKKTTVNPMGKPTKCAVIFKGTYKDIDVTVKFEAETERDIDYQIPLIPEKSLELEITDPQVTLDVFCTDEAALKKISDDAKWMIDEEDEFRDERKRRSEEGQ